MKTFSQYVSENFNVSRISMPQIDDVQKFLAYLESIDVGYYNEYGYVDALKATQSEGFDEYKISNIAMQIRKDPDSIPKMKPMLVSQDGYVMDGHHRALAGGREKVKMPYIVVDTTSNKLLKLAYDFTAN